MFFFGVIDFSVAEFYNGGIETNSQRGLLFLDVDGNCSRFVDYTMISVGEWFPVFVCVCLVDDCRCSSRRWINRYYSLAVTTRQATAPPDQPGQTPAYEEPPVEGDYSPVGRMMSTWGFFVVEYQ